MTFKFAYFKLTLFYVLIVMIISSSFSFALYELSSAELSRGLNRQTLFLRNLPRSAQSGEIINFDEIRLEQLVESSNRIKANLVYFNLLILILSTFFSYFWAKKTLSPIEESVENQTRFTADASHELRTPLAALRAEIEVGLRDKKLNLTKSKALLKSNLEEIDKLESLATALLTLARSQEKNSANFQRLVLTDVIIEAYERIEKLAQRKAIKFSNKLTNLSIFGNKSSLTQLFVILLDNAIKYSNPRATIFINVYKNKKRASVSIKDQGCGIAPQDLNHIFDRFYRADTSRCKAKTQGFGLGLSIAREIVNFHHGKIEVKSKHGRGSEFLVHFHLA